MEAKRQEELLKKYQLGTIQQAEIEELFDWYNQQASQQLPIDQHEIHFRLNRIAEKLPARPSKSSIFYLTRKIWIGSAAAALLIGAIGISLWQLKPVQKGIAVHTLAKIVPDTNAHPIWTNQAGQHIDLAQMKKDDTLKTDGLVIFKNKAGFLTYQSIHPTSTPTSAPHTMQTIRTPAGSNLKLLLADGTKVWLNAASELRFYTDIDHKDRVVELEGEAYFEVIKQHDTQGLRKHFLVRSEQQLVEVLGTKFNIKNYKDDYVSTTSLYEGSIRLETNQTERTNKKAVILKPGQQSILNKTSFQLDFKNLQQLDQLSWREGYFNFDGESIQLVCQQLSRWYPVNFEIDAAVPPGEYHGSISKSYSLNEVLDILTQNKLHVEFKNSNDQIVVRLTQK